MFRIAIAIHKKMKYCISQEDKMFGIGFQELLVILFIVLLLFGAKKVPELAKGLGNALREFRKAAKDIDSDEDKPEEPPYKA